MEKLSVRDFKKHLSTMTFEEIIVDITALYKDVPAVKEYYLAKLCPTAEADLLQKYKEIIKDEFFPRRGFGKARASVIRKAIGDFKKVAKLPNSVVELLFFHVSIGVDFTKTYGDIDEAFYNSLVSSFEQAMKYSVKYDIYDEVKEDAEALHEKCQGFGWGFSDNISDVYYEYLDEEDFDDPIEDK